MHDVVIVGAGTAGCVLASRLTEDPDVSVLLIEAGARSRKLETKIPAAFFKLFRTEVDWGDSTTPQGGLDGREIVFPRGRMLGGTAAMNAMMVLRGHRADYDAWAAHHGCPGWSWADVEPAFSRSARAGFPLAELPDRHVLGEAFVHAAQAVGIPFAEDLNAEDNAGVGFVPVSQRRGRRSACNGYGPARRRRT
jgi:choline dehydrogenase